MERKTPNLRNLTGIVKINMCRELEKGSVARSWRAEDAASGYLADPLALPGAALQTPLSLFKSLSQEHLS